MLLSVHMMQTVTSYVWFSPLAGFYTLCLLEFLTIISLCQQFQSFCRRGEMCFLSLFCIQNSHSHCEGFYGVGSSEGQSQMLYIKRTETTKDS